MSDLVSVVEDPASDFVLGDESEDFHLGTIWPVQAIVSRDLPYWWLVETRSLTAYRSGFAEFAPWSGQRAGTARCVRDHWPTPPSTAGIDAEASKLAEPARRNFERWPVLGTVVLGNPDPPPESYAEEVAWLKAWLHGRLSWLDRALAAREEPP